MLQYDPSAIEARGGNKLLRRADIHLGYRVSFLAECRAQPVTRGRQSASVQQKRVLVFGTLEGGVGLFAPMEERMYRRLSALQAVMINALPHDCALNPRSFRLMEQPSTAVEERRKNFLDGQLLWRYVGLDARIQEELAGAIGTSRSVILDNLLEIDIMSAVI